MVVAVEVAVPVAVGLSVGEAVGRADGAADGVADGCEDGVSVGLSVGRSVGANGDMLGVSVVATDGVAVTTSAGVGDTVGSGELFSMCGLELHPTLVSAPVCSVVTSNFPASTCSAIKRAAVCKQVPAPPRKSAAIMTTRAR